MLYFCLDKLGDHGYDNNWIEMSPIFMASGPLFRTFSHVQTLKPIYMVDLYPLMSYILNLTVLGSHNGSLARVSYLLRNTTDYTLTSRPVYRVFDSKLDVFLGNLSKLLWISFLLV